MIENTVDLARAIGVDDETIHGVARRWRRKG